ncbi:uncharacterized protein BP5553_09734 [Venustampulla echinocandica]|uniref:Large ribosomal subunit protein mL45 n=1 Tax=Venustampulla echinocandica TaxID=2656787 RepID=A0A370TBV5_9HELO|nr:uncharacterized protein BP5553_09734 [Venustampulla echinocandica]RDL31525.1 hypothetical protein BP5553_09734 [Venustampulla echinocandica]
MFLPDPSATSTRPPIQRGGYAYTKEPREELPSTFIPPYATVKLTSTPLQYLFLQYKRLRYKARNVFALCVFKLSSPADPNGRWYSRTVKLHGGRITPTALALHKQMYSAFAEGDSQTLRKICTDGLYDSFMARLAARRKGEQVVWELVQYNRRAKMVSNRAARYPIEGSGVMQAVVRIDSTQRLTRLDQDGEVIGGSGKAKDAVEYLVLQKQFHKWTGAEWRVWGTVEETDLDTLRAWEKDDD